MQVPLLVLTVAGLIQGSAWLNGETVYRVLPEIHIYYIVRASLGLMVFVSALIGLVNILMTLYVPPGQLISHKNRRDHGVVRSLERADLKRYVLVIIHVSGE